MARGCWSGVEWGGVQDAPELQHGGYAYVLRRALCFQYYYCRTVVARFDRARNLIWSVCMDRSQNIIPTGRYCQGIRKYLLLLRMGLKYDSYICNGYLLLLLRMPHFKEPFATRYQVLPGNRYFTAASNEWVSKACNGYLPLLLRIIKASLETLHGLQLLHPSALVPFLRPLQRRFGLAVSTAA